MAKISRKNFLKAGIAAGALAGGIVSWKYAPGILSARNRDARPNILMLTLDTTRYDRMGFNGYNRDTTPNLDKIAEQGVVFHKNYCQAPITIPSISSLITSKYPSSLGTVNLESTFSDVNYTLAELLKIMGYKTFGVTGVFFLREKQGFRQGFELFSSPVAPSAGISPSMYTAIRRAKDSVDKLISMVTLQHTKFPCFFWVHFYDAHVPYTAPDKFTFKFHTRGNFDDTTKICYGLLRAPDGSSNGERAAFGLLTEKQVVKHSDQYDGQISYMDSQIDRLLSYLREKGLFDLRRDLFILTSDHGELLGERGSFASHHGGYEEVTHVPLFMSGAGLPKGKEIDALTANLDVVPTILDIANIDKNNISSLDEKIARTDLKGNSLRFLIAGEGVGRKYVITELPPKEGLAVRTQNFRLIKRFNNYANLPGQGPVDGFYPSGVSIEYHRHVKETEPTLYFEWPYRVDVSKFRDAQVFFKLSYFDGDNTFLPITEQSFAYSTPSFSLACPWLSSESKWNRQATYDYYVWEVKIREDGGDDDDGIYGTVLFDSNQYGLLAFQIAPTTHFNEMFYVREPGSRGNIIEEVIYGKDGSSIYEDPKYGEVRLKLEKIVLEFRNSLGRISSQQIEINAEEKESLRSLGYL
ncbi:MAG: hypothetical protein AMXMBFR4_12620 [Candidatus Hydrogenedentota bacterium]